MLPSAWWGPAPKRKAIGGGNSASELSNRALPGAIWGYGPWPVGLVLAVAISTQADCCSGIAKPSSLAWPVTFSWRSAGPAANSAEDWGRVAGQPWACHWVVAAAFIASNTKRLQSPAAYREGRWAYNSAERLAEHVVCCWQIDNLADTVCSCSEKLPLERMNGTAAQQSDTRSQRADLDTQIHLDVHCQVGVGWRRCDAVGVPLKQRNVWAAQKDVLAWPAKVHQVISAASA